MGTARNVEQGSTVEELTKKAVPIARNAHLRAINLQALNVDLLTEPTDESIAALVHSEHAVEHVLEKIDDVPYLTVRVRFSVTVRSDEQELFKLKATFSIQYVLNKGMPERASEGIPAFASTNSIVHVWPYYRELVQSMAWRMGIPPFPLPLFRVTDQLPKAHKSESNEER